MQFGSKRKISLCRSLFFIVLQKIKYANVLQLHPKNAADSPHFSIHGYFFMTAHLPVSLVSGFYTHLMEKVAYKRIQILEPRTFSWYLCPSLTQPGGVAALSSPSATQTLIKYTSLVSGLSGLVEEERLRRRESSGGEEPAGQRSLTCEGARGRMERKREEEVWKTQANTTACMTFINHPI